MRDRSRSLGVVMLVLIVASPAFYGVATSDQLEENTQNFEDWCDASEGELVYSHAVLDGGLQCHLPDGEVRRYGDTLDNVS